MSYQIILTRLKRTIDKWSKLPLISVRDRQKQYSLKPGYQKLAKFKAL